MIRGTTPVLSFKIPVLPSELDACYISFYQEVYENYTYTNRRYVEKNLSDCTLDDVTQTVTVTLTQSDTLAFDASKPVIYQLRFRVGDTAYATMMATFTIGDILKSGEI